MTERRLLVRARAMGIGIIVLWGGSGVRAAAVGDPNVAIAVDCPLLGAEPKAALEARARAELMVRLASGTLVVFCRSEASLAWHPVDGQSAEVDVPVSGDPNTDVERILEALVPLLAPRASPEPHSSSGVLSLAPTAPAAPVAPPADGASPTLPKLVSRRPPPTTTRWSIAVGALGEAWSGKVVGALGPRLLLDLHLSEHFSLSGGGAALWALKNPDDVSARLLRPQLGVTYALDSERRFRASVDASLDFLHAAGAVSLHTSVANRTIPGAIVRVSYVVMPGPVRVMFGPLLALHPGKTLVELGDREVFHIPMAVVGFAVEGEFGPIY